MHICCLADLCFSCITRTFALNLTYVFCFTRHFTSENQLISTGSKAQRRWEYKSLGDALVRKFPCLSWENPGPKTKIYKQRTQIFVSDVRMMWVPNLNKWTFSVQTVFMHKLATTRKVRKFRNSKPAVLAGPVLPTITKEQAMAELNVSVFVIKLNKKHIPGLR